MTPRVLVAEGSATLQTLIRMTLEGDGLVVHCVGDGRAALSSWRESPPQLLIADAALPDLNGYALVEHLRADPTAQGVPVLLLTSDHATPDLERLDHLGIQDVLTKPFEQHDLLERVRAMLGRRSDPIQEERPTLSSPAPVTQPRSFTPPTANPARVAPTPTHSAERSSPPATPTLPEHLVREAVNHWLATEGQAVILASVEKVVWKVVPELAEQVIRDEIRRLTEEDDP